MSSKNCEKWEAKCKQYRVENKIHLEIFKKYLINQNLSKKRQFKNMSKTPACISMNICFIMTQYQWKMV